MVLHNFACPPKGASPTAGVTEDAAGNLYGTAVSGGAAGWGVVYKLNWPPIENTASPLVSIRTKGTIRSTRTALWKFCGQDVFCGFMKKRPFTGEESKELGM